MAQLSGWASRRWGKTADPDSPVQPPLCRARGSPSRHCGSQRALVAGGDTERLQSTGAEMRVWTVLLTHIPAWVPTLGNTHGNKQTELEAASASQVFNASRPTDFVTKCH